MPLFQFSNKIQLLQTKTQIPFTKKMSSFNQPVIYHYVEKQVLSVALSLFKADIDNEE
ncbi:hypothetical protein GCM10028807_18850 [Spirosoma daeguense]